MIFLTLIIFTTSYASNVLTYKEIANRNKKTSEKSNTSSTKGKSYKKELELANKKLESYRYITKMQLKKPIIFKDVLVYESEFIGAKSLLAIRATNSPQLATFSSIEAKDITPENRILCNVMVKHKRVCGTCSRIIIDGVGHSINATLNNKDGSPCVVGEVSDDGETYLTGIAVSELAQGALSLSQSSIPTQFGNIVAPTSKNKIAQGLINVGEEASNLFKEEYQTRESIVTIAPHTPVVIQFNKEFSL
jgi:hypothetical protein